MRKTWCEVVRGQTCMCCTAFCTACFLSVGVVISATTFVAGVIGRAIRNRAGGLVEVRLRRLKVVTFGDLLGVAQPRADNMFGKDLCQFRLTC